jgi:hypothetical protein
MIQGKSSNNLLNSSLVNNRDSSSQLNLHSSSQLNLHSHHKQFKAHFLRCSLKRSQLLL